MHLGRTIGGSTQLDGEFNGEPLTEQERELLREQARISDAPPEGQRKAEELMPHRSESSYRVECFRATLLNLTKRTHTGRIPEQPQSGRRIPELPQSGTLPM
jgi:hypothetical protein